LRIFSNRFPNGIIDNSYDKLEYVGIDLNQSRVDMSNKFLPILFKHFEKKINFNLMVGDLSSIKFDDKYFDYSFVPSVLERIDNKNIEKVISELCRVTDKGIFITDFYDRYPLGYPRTHKELNKLFSKYGFNLSIYDYKMTDTHKNQCELHAFFVSKN